MNRRLGLLQRGVPIECRQWCLDRCKDFGGRGGAFPLVTRGEITPSDTRRIVITKRGKTTEIETTTPEDWEWTPPPTPLEEVQPEYDYDEYYYNTIEHGLYGMRQVPPGFAPGNYYPGSNSRPVFRRVL